MRTREQIVDECCSDEVCAACMQEYLEGIDVSPKDHTCLRRVDYELGFQDGRASE